MTYLGINTPELRFDNFTAKWDHRPLGELGSFKNGLNKDKADFGFGVEFVNLMDVFGKSILEDVQFNLVNASQKEIDSYNLQSGDVLFIRSSVKRTGVGETSLIPKDLHNIVYSGFLIRFRENSKTLDLNYKRYCFSIGSFRKKLLSLATTSANTNINQESLEKILLSFPSLPEQQKIAAFLSAMDKKIQFLQRKKELLEQYKKGVMQKIFSQEIRFKDENGNDFPDWEERQLRDMDIYIADGNYGELYPKSDEMKSEGVPFIRANNIKDLQLVWDDMKFIDEKLHMTLKSGHLKFDDVLVTTRGEIGMVAYVDKPFEYANINAQICLLRCGPSVSSYFLLQYLHSAGGKKQFKRYETGSALKQLPKKSLGTIKIPVPRIDEQTLIADFLKTIDGKLLSIRKQIAVVIQFKNGLLQQMFV